MMLLKRNKTISSYNGYKTIKMIKSLKYKRNS
jgi:hypothetical protein